MFYSHLLGHVKQEVSHTYIKLLFFCKLYIHCLLVNQIYELYEI